MSQTIYNYHPQTGEFLSQDQADPSPLEPGVFLAPAYATAIEPPPTEAHQAAVFDGAQWRITPDWRGHSYWRSDGTRHSIAELGQTPPADALDAPPPPPLDAIKAAVLSQVRARRERAFATLAGCQSEALTLGDAATAQAIAQLQHRLRDLPATTDLSQCQTQADIEAAFDASWANLAAQAPAQLRLALGQLRQGVAPNAGS